MALGLQVDETIERNGKRSRCRSAAMVRGTNKAVNRNAGCNRDVIDRDGVSWTVDVDEIGVELLDKQ